MLLSEFQPGGVFAPGVITITAAINGTNVYNNQANEVGARALKQAISLSGAPLLRPDPPHVPRSTLICMCGDGLQRASAGRAYHQSLEPGHSNAVSAPSYKRP
jgi:hypothetical protein